MSAHNAVSEAIQDFTNLIEETRTEYDWTDHLYMRFWNAAMKIYNAKTAIFVTNHSLDENLGDDLTDSLVKEMNNTDVVPPRPFAIEINNGEEVASLVQTGLLAWKRNLHRRLRKQAVTSLERSQNRPPNQFETQSETQSENQDTNQLDDKNRAKKRPRSPPPRSPSDMGHNPTNPNKEAKKKKGKSEDDVEKKARPPASPLEMLEK